MKNFDWKKILPHVYAIGIFLIVSVFYCSPALQGKVLQQSDVVHWKGMAQNGINYKEAHGHFPLWNTNLFSGMPNYQVTLESKSFLVDFGKILSLGLPKPISFFFLACVCFYILCMAFRSNFVVAVLGSLAYAYATYNPIIISVGHETKMMAIAYMPALLAGLILLYQKKYVLGLTVTALFATLEIGANHPQINYYFIIIAFFMTVAYIIQWIKAKEWKHLFIALGLAVLGGLIGVGNAAVSLLTTADYAKYTMRGGKTIEGSGAQMKQVKTTGLDVDYALNYSAGKSEFLTFLMPNVFGSSSSETFDENSKVVTALTEKNIPENTAVQIATQLPKYWGGIESGTSGPVYFGAIICMLFLIGLVTVKNENRWWILAATVFALLLSWGSYFLGFNKFLLANLPFYNKFRAPSMALVIPQLLFPLMAVLCLQQIFFQPNAKQELQKSFKKILYISGGTFVILILMYFLNDYNGSIDPQVIKGYTDPQTGSNEFGRQIVNAMIQERKSMFGSGIFRAIIFAGITVGALYLYTKNTVKPVLIVTAFIVINTIDLFTIDTKYLNRDSYIESDSYESGNFTPTAADNQILQDKDPHFRVYNLAPDRYQESITAYFHRCVGGYHPAKLRIYQDLIENHLSKNNMSVLNMLDTKYFLIPPQQQQQQQGQSTVQRNDSAMGACWFVKEVKFVNGPVEEIKALDNFNPATTAFVDNSFKSIATTATGADPAAKISLVSYDNDDIKYTSASTTNQFAVFSEIYYPAGWNAYIDGKKTDYCKTNYVLRGMVVPAGNHTIEFKFEPESYYKGQTFVYISNILLWLSILASLFVAFRKPIMKETKKA
ncbi:MAG: hypothetical protein JWQ40_2906 [Segetibacter sp.]|nr:hypothetical protein [Segetibacter sp.]